MPRSHRKHRVAEMNVVPYIDVMLVLLIIFMITSPLLTQQVEVQLPSINLGTKPVPTEQGSVVMFTVTEKGEILRQNEELPLSSEELNTYLSKLAKNERFTQLQFYIKGDAKAPYSKIVELVGYLKSKGITEVGLLTQTH
jgi:biopolymer transport protein TolR